MGSDVPVGTKIIFCTGVGDFLQAEENADYLQGLDSLRSEASIKAGDGGRNLWKDVAKFDPRRWLTTDSETGQLRFNPKAGYNAAFGIGPRVCAGRNIAVSRLNHSVIEARAYMLSVD